MKTKSISPQSAVKVFSSRNIFFQNWNKVVGPRVCWMVEWSNNFSVRFMQTSQPQNSLEHNLKQNEKNSLSILQIIFFFCWLFNQKNRRHNYGYEADNSFVGRTPKKKQNKMKQNFFHLLSISICEWDLCAAIFFSYPFLPKCLFVKTNHWNGKNQLT